MNILIFSPKHWGKLGVIYCNFNQIGQFPRFFSSMFWFLSLIYRPLLLPISHNVLIIQCKIQNRSTYFTPLVTIIVTLARKHTSVDILHSCFIQEGITDIGFAALYVIGTRKPFLDYVRPHHTTMINVRNFTFFLDFT